MRHVHFDRVIFFRDGGKLVRGYPQHATGTIARYRPLA